MIFAWKVLGSRPGSFPVCANGAPPTASPLAWISVRVRAEIDEHLPDDLAWSVAWQVTVVDRRRYDHWSLGRVYRRCEVGR